VPCPGSGVAQLSTLGDFTIMKIFSIFIVLASLLAASCASTPESADSSPFHSVVVRDGAIVATLPATPRWIVQIGSSDSRTSEPSESFTLQDGASLRLVEHHLNYKVTAQIAPKPGLKVESTMDARSFGGEITKKSYFIPAK
jgi:hypothetical protein